MSRIIAEGKTSYQLSWKVKVIKNNTSYSGVIIKKSVEIFGTQKNDRRKKREGKRVPNNHTTILVPVDYSTMRVENAKRQHLCHSSARQASADRQAMPHKPAREKIQHGKTRSTDRTVQARRGTSTQHPRAPEQTLPATRSTHAIHTPCQTHDKAQTLAKAHLNFVVKAAEQPLFGLESYLLHRHKLSRVLVHAEVHIPAAPHPDWLSLFPVPLAYATLLSRQPGARYSPRWRREAALRMGRVA